MDFSRIDPQASVFKNDDPQLNKKLAATFGGKPRRTRGIEMHVVARTGQPLQVTGRVTTDHTVAVTILSDTPLELARKHAITEQVLVEKLGRLGGTVFHLDQVDAEIDGAPLVPLAILNATRRKIVEQLTEKVAQSPVRTVNVQAGWELADTLRVSPHRESRQNSHSHDEAILTTDAETGLLIPGSVSLDPKLSVLCRTMQQLEAAVGSNVDTVIADFHDVRAHRQAVQVARDAGVPILLASLRMQKPGEMGFIRQILKYKPDGVLARNLAVLDAAVREGVETIADFSLNVANHRSAEWLMERGVSRLTTSYDLNAEQLDGLIQAVPGEWIEVVMHQHMPMFHMEHCVFCSVLSPGTNKTNCGRPCDSHAVHLRDRVGKLHVLQADIACRNTLYNATPQSAADVVASLIEREVKWFRVELLEEDRKRSGEVLRLYRQLLCGQISGPEVWRRLAADNRVGVTCGTLEAKRNPLAIL